jgi:hypothetical protein
MAALKYMSLDRIQMVDLVPIQSSKGLYKFELPNGVVLVELYVRVEKDNWFLTKHNLSDSIGIVVRDINGDILTRQSHHIYGMDGLSDRVASDGVMEPGGSIAANVISIPIGK